jgi:hypothetical protein
MNSPANGAGGVQMDMLLGQSAGGLWDTELPKRRQKVSLNRHVRRGVGDRFSRARGR